MKKEMINKGKFLNLVRMGRWEYVEREGMTPGKPDAVVIIAKKEDGAFVCIKEKRIPLLEAAPKSGGYEIGFPAGLIDEGETASTSGVRELKEETGFVMGDEVYETPIMYNSAGLTNESCVIIYGSIVSQGEQELQDHEDIEVISIKNLTELKIYIAMGYAVGAKVMQHFVNLDMMEKLK